MKFSKYVMLAGLAGMLGACASDAPDAPNTTTPEGEVGYIRIAFEGLSESTRAVGDENDNISSADFLFFTEGTDGNDGSYLGHVVVNSGDNSDSQKWLKDHSATNDICAVVKVPYANATRVTVILNKTNSTNGITGDQIATLALKDNDYKNASGSFVMSNAVTYDEHNEATWRVALDKTHFYATMNEAIAADATPTAKINVERTVAKVTVKEGKVDDTKLLSADGNVSLGTDLFDVAGDDKYELIFEPTNIYVTNFRDQGALIKQLPTYPTGMSASNIQNGDRSFIAAHLAGSALTNYTYPQLSTVGTSLFTDNVSYVYDNAGSNAGTTRTATALAVVGDYTVKKGGVTVNADADGNLTTFYLVGITNKWKVCLTPAEVLEAMGATSSTKLKKQMQKVGENEVWTGYMVLENEETPIVCLKYENAHGYYTKTIERYANRAYITRNHHYQLSVNQITGVGIGIPDGNTPIEPITPPNPDDKNFYLHLSVKVLDWYDVEQNVAW